MHADINTKTGEIRLERLMEVVEEVENYDNQIPIDLARADNPDIQVGDFTRETLPPLDFGRVAGIDSVVRLCNCVRSNRCGSGLERSLSGGSVGILDGGTGDQCFNDWGDLWSIWSEISRRLFGYNSCWQYRGRVAVRWILVIRCWSGGYCETSCFIGCGVS